MGHSLRPPPTCATLYRVCQHRSYHRARPRSILIRQAWQSLHVCENYNLQTANGQVALPSPTFAGATFPSYGQDITHDTYLQAIRAIRSVLCIHTNDIQPRYPQFAAHSRWALNFMATPYPRTRMPFSSASGTNVLKFSKLWATEQFLFRCSKASDALFRH